MNAKDMKLIKLEQILLLKRKTTSVIDKFPPHAEELLSKAIKYELKLIELSMEWNVGERYSKNDNPQSTKNGFVGALPHVSRIWYLLLSEIIRAKKFVIEINNGKIW